MTDSSTSTGGHPTGLSRRALLGAFGAGALTVAGAGVAVAAVASDGAESANDADLMYPFRGEHQSGITTPMQEYLHFAALDVATDSRADLIEMLRRWTLAAEDMTQLVVQPH